MKNPVIIGAGGVASYLLPVLLKSFKPSSITIVDKDTLEQRNLDRQMFRATDVGKNKAEALMGTVLGINPILSKHNTFTQAGLTVRVIKEWFTSAMALPEDTDAIICVADNHMARHAALTVADERGIMAYVGGNEYLDSQAFAYHPEWKGSKRDPLVRNPNIATDESGSPFRCTGDAQEASPQLAVANLNCAAKLLHLMWVYERWLPEQGLGLDAMRTIRDENLPCEMFSSAFENSHV